MNGLLMSVLFLASSAFAVPITSEEAAELNNAAALSDYGYGNMYPQYPVMDKRDGRPSLADYLRLAAMQYELDKEEEASAQTQEVLASPSAGELSEVPEAHSVDKRRRYYYNRKKCTLCHRYGFWVTAINKMGNGGKRSVFRPVRGGHPMLMG
eukprot:01936.XXX_16346_14036_1 [CDS] Oithona nana genome sequencing.